jgi:TatD DNase family protein
MVDPLFDNDRQTVIDRARNIGVEAIVAVGETLADAERNIALARRYPILRPAAGLYPAHLDRQQAEKTAAFIRDHHRELFAIGEVGLDFWVVKDSDLKALQREIFGYFIDLAIELDLPLNVHSRSAGHHAISQLIKKGARRVHLHAFDGKASRAQPAIEAGYCFSIPPSLVRSRQKQKLVKSLPLSCLLLETDSPVLGPTASQRNEPANILQAVDAIAELKGVSTEEVREAAYRNTVGLYGPLLSDAQDDLPA